MVDETLNQILRLVREYKSRHEPARFVPGETNIPYAARIFDSDEFVNLVEAALEGWLTAGPYASRFEKAFADYFGLAHCALANSGSSANLLALSALTSPSLGDRRLKPGDEVITVAAAFPTTVNPIVQCGLIPVFLDIDPATYNIRADLLEAALSPATRAIILAHAFGNPFNLDKVMEIARARDLWLIEDCCDAVGSTYRGRPVGTFGHLATVSFYAAHHMTMGEGGAVLTNETSLHRLVCSFRDWGRDCFCEPGVSNTCGRRFSQQYGELPHGYDHKYVFSHIGYNLKLTDLQAAVGLAQLNKLPDFLKARRRNFQLLRSRLESCARCLILPESTAESDPAWFAFPVTVKHDAPFPRSELVARLERQKIQTRSLFAGNILRHPAYSLVSRRVAGELTTTDSVLKGGFFIGVYPGITVEMIDYMASTIIDFIGQYR